jgi:acylphosphatase
MAIVKFFLVFAGFMDYSCAMAQFAKNLPAHRRACYFSGRVQGVGFRYTAQNIAMQHDVGGYVRNLPDGRVELVLEGPDSEMDMIVEELRRRMECHIRGTQLDESAATGEFERFSIKY